MAAGRFATERIVLPSDSSESLSQLKMQNMSMNSRSQNSNDSGVGQLVEEDN